MASGRSIHSESLEESASSLIEIIINHLMMIPSSKYLKSTMRKRHSLNANHTRLIRVAFAAFALLLVSTVVGSSLIIIRNRAGEEATHSESLVPDNGLFEHKEGKLHDAGPSISPTSSTSIPTYTASHEPTILNTNASSSNHPISRPSALNPESSHPSTFLSESPTELSSDLPSITQSKNSGNNVGDFDEYNSMFLVTYLTIEKKRKFSNRNLKRLISQLSPRMTLLYLLCMLEISCRRISRNVAKTNLELSQQCSKSPYRRSLS